MDLTENADFGRRDGRHDGRFRLADFEAQLRAAGARVPHRTLVMRDWLAGRPLDHSRRHREFPYPKRLAAALPALERRLSAVVEVVERAPSSDGAVRSALELADGARIESVLLPRGALCVSVQAGCAVGCRFCLTGAEGLARNLDAVEILAQVVLARRQAPVRRVVTMGMGDALHNLGQVLAAFRLLAGPGLMPHKQLTLSTVGSEALFARLLREPVRPSLALSLHSLDAARRRALLPHAPAAEPRALLASALAYAEATHWPLQIQWTLLAGVNDSPSEFEELAALTAGRRAIVNLIPWNEGPGLPFRRPPAAHTERLARLLRRRGVPAAIRRSVGAEIGAACGQLVRRRAGRAPAAPGI